MRRTACLGQDDVRLGRSPRRPWSVLTAQVGVDGRDGRRSVSVRCLQAHAHTHATAGRTCMANSMGGGEMSGGGLRSVAWASVITLNSISVITLIAVK